MANLASYHGLMELKTQDERFMSRAIELAKMGLGGVSPNPLVGCVLVKDGLIIGEGYHKQYGGPHAEVNAVNDVKDPVLLVGATAYVTLEPCSHHGKTPPCADLLVASKVGRVVIAHEDPHPLVNGKGIEKLRDAGIEVSLGILREEYAEVNRRFFVSTRDRRPYVILKWAQTADGFIARKNFDSKWISNPQARQLVHKWRSEEDAILVGKNTAQHDDPALTVRDWQGRHPMRIVIDPQLTLPPTLQLFDRKVKTVIINHQKEEENGQLQWLSINTQRFEEEVLQRLHGLKIGSVFIEGGAETLRRFIGVGLWDEARVFHSPTVFEEGIAAPVLEGNLVEQHHVTNNTLHIYHNN
ncbi:MAG: bifunctional diaminohydroxyphosphoribosylaminopyrimidine deaminase/5-amino-6-(5-phosphoribosylamino)uracil reductase RibD [Bacteroidota bacterium]